MERGVSTYIEVDGLKGAVETLRAARDAGARLVSANFAGAGELSMLAVAEPGPEADRFLAEVERAHGARAVRVLAEVQLDHARPILTGALREFVAALGGAAKVFMCHLGLHFGREIAAVLSSARRMEAVERAPLILRGSGLGRGGLVEYAWRERCVIRVRDPFECAGLMAGELASRFSRGLSSELLAGLWGWQRRRDRVRGHGRHALRVPSDSQAQRLSGRRLA